MGEGVGQKAGGRAGAGQIIESIGELNYGKTEKNNSDQLGVHRRENATATPATPRALDKTAVERESAMEGGRGAEGDKKQPHILAHC